MKRQRGFTLLELLVAIGIFALVSAIAYGSLIHFMDDRAHLDAEHEFWRKLSLVYIRMEDDFSQARDRPIRDPIGLPNPQPAFRGQPTDTRATGAPSVEFTRGGVLTLGSGTRSDLQRVGYRLDDGTLKRLVWPVLDPGPQTEPLELPLLKNVESFRVRFFLQVRCVAGSVAIGKRRRTAPAGRGGHAHPEGARRIQASVSGQWLSIKHPSSAHDSRGWR